MKAPEKPIVFISYSQKNMVWKDRIVKHLKGFRNDFQLFVDRHDLKKEYQIDEPIQEAIEVCSAVVLLLSPAFFSSKYIMEKELPLILERHKASGIPIVPILIATCVWDRHKSISQFNVRMTENGLPFASLDDVDRDLRNRELTNLAGDFYDIVLAYLQEPQVRVMVADDHEFAVRGLSEIVNNTPDFRVVGTCTNSLQVEEKAKRFQPDLLLLDLTWFRNDEIGLALVQKIKILSPETQIITISNYDNLLERSASLGAYPISKGFQMGQLRSHMAYVYNKKQSEIPQGDIGLTNREKEVLGWVAQGDSDKEIADKMGLALSTIKTYITRLMQKMDARNRTDAAVKGKELGII